MVQYILALDQGTTSSRAILFDKQGNIIACEQQEFTQIFPHPGWVEHDPMEIWNTQKSVAQNVLSNNSISPDQIASIGITNQRETTIIWEKDTGNPVHNAIVWQCRRTASICDSLKQQGLDECIREKTGLLIDPYFSGTKIKWILENYPDLFERAQKGELCFGTVDSWLLFNLTGEHKIEISNASRTLLFNIHQAEWDRELLNIFNIPGKILPEIIPSCGTAGVTKKDIFGKEIPVTGIAGDQQAALFGQACFNDHDAKNTYGTGCFTLVNTGKRAIRSEHRLLTTIAWDLGNGPIYALEGSVFIGGEVIKWLRDQLNIINDAAETDQIASSIPSTEGVYFVPGFVGLGAPHWDSGSRGTIVGLTRGSSRAHIVRAALESIAFQTHDLVTALEADLNHRINDLKVDGGASVNSFLMQFQADILDIPVIRSQISETTALGAAYLSGLSSGYWNDIDEITQNWHEKQHYTPQISSETRKALLADWSKAIKTSMQFQVETTG